MKIDICKHHTRNLPRCVAFGVGEREHSAAAQAALHQFADDERSRGEDLPEVRAIGDRNVCRTIQRVAPDATGHVRPADFRVTASILLNQAADEQRARHLVAVELRGSREHDQ